MDSNAKIIEGYNNYLKKNNIEINSKIEDRILYQFDSQGSIRARFEQKDENDIQQFLEEKFPEAPSKFEYLDIINKQFEKLYDILNYKFQFDAELKQLPTLLMVSEEVNRNNISINKLVVNKKNSNGISRVIKYLKKINSSISDVDKKISDGLLDEDAKIINNFKQSISLMISKYQKILKKFNQEYDVKTGINLGIGKFTEQLISFKTDLENKKDEFNVNVNETALIISNLVFNKRQIKHFSFDQKIKIPVKAEITIFDEYSFVRRFKNVKEINKDYLESILNRILKKNCIIDTEIITEMDLQNYIKDDKKSTTCKTLDLLKSRVEEIINNDFDIESVILKSNQNVYDNLSRGLNATLYFDIISTDDKDKGIYIVDQPEDDVSQKAIRDRLIKDFKTMFKHRQIILITHNPQFVVNLDVDNVICIEKNKDGKIDINYGALEYEDANTNIIEKVALNLDGGVDSIKKRWKRYEKTSRIEEIK